MNNRVIHYEADGLEMVGRLYVSAAAKPRGAGVLVFPEAFGLGEHACSRAERLAELGYVALACDYYGGGRMFGMTDVGDAIAPLRAEPARVRVRAQAGLQALLANAEIDAARVAAIGYCFGGTMALELARDGAQLAAVVGFHSGLATAAPDDAKQIHGKVLVCIGADDPLVPLEQRLDFEREMRDARVDWRMNLYGGVVHSFTNPGADDLKRPEVSRYDAAADAHSWRDMLGLFDSVFA